MQIYLWAPIYRENWSAFAPDFEELEENREYIEREDEFDINERPEDRALALAEEAATSAGAVYPPPLVSERSGGLRGGVGGDHHLWHMLRPHATSHSFPFPVLLW